MHFIKPLYLLLMLAAPLLLLTMAVAGANATSRARKFAADGIDTVIRPYRSKGRRLLRAALLLLGVLLVAFSAAGPMFGASFEQVQRRSLDIVIGIDTSKSMLAEDVRPSRLDFAKREIERIVARLKGDRVALLPFSGEAYLLCPLTMDYSAIKMFLGVIDTQIIPTGGTDLAGAIDAARTAFADTERSYRVMILLTDGEDLKGEARAAAARAKDDHIVIFVIGIGTKEGHLIPQVDSEGNLAYIRDKSGQPVMSKMDPATLEAVARETGGLFVQGTYDESALDAIFYRLERMERQEKEGKLITKYKARYQWFLISGMVLIAAGLYIRERRGGGLL